MAVGPGVTALQRIPSFAYRSATSLEKESIAALDTEYSGMLPEGRFAGGRGDVHDRAAATLAHPGQHRLSRTHGAHHVQLPGLLPELLGQLLEAVDLGPADVVDEAVDAAKTLERSLDQPLGLPGREIGRDVEIADPLATAAGGDDFAPSACSCRATSSPIPPVEPVTTQTLSWRPRSICRASLVVVTTILLARHGQTDWNRERRWQGLADPPLNEVGREQARALARSLDGVAIDAVYASDLRRATETAEIVAARLELPVQTDPGLREIDVGEWSGLTTAEIEGRFPEAFAHHNAGGDGWEHGETHAEMSERCRGGDHADRSCASRRTGSLSSCTGARSAPCSLMPTESTSRSTA